MPARRCQLNNRPGWKWGGRGKCYTFKRGSKSGSRRAKGKANLQGRAVRVSQTRKRG